MEIQNPTICIFRFIFSDKVNSHLSPPLRNKNVHVSSLTLRTRAESALSPRAESALSPRAESALHPRAESPLYPRVERGGLAWVAPKPDLK